jgi:hypothetical protein
LSVFNTDVGFNSRRLHQTSSKDIQELPKDGT